MPDRAHFTKSRIEPVALESTDPEIRELLNPLGDRASSNFFRTIVRNPRIFKRWVPYSVALLHGCVPERDRELLVLRAAHRSESEYEWQHHMAFAKAAGLTDEDITRVKHGPAASGWGPFDATLLKAADELIDDHEISDSTWDALAGRYDERQMIEVPLLVGVYYATGLTLNTLGVQLEEDIG